MISDFYPMPAWAPLLVGKLHPSKRRPGQTTSVSYMGCALLAVLARYQGDNADAWPLVTTLAADVGVSTRSIVQQLEALEDAGALEVSRRCGARSRYRVQRPSGEASFTGSAVDDSQSGEASFTGEPGFTGEPSFTAPVNAASPGGEACFTAPVKLGSPLREQEEISKETNEETRPREPWLIVAAAYRDRYEREKRAPWMSHAKSRSDLELLARWCVEVATREGRDLEAVAAQLLDNAFGDSWLIPRHWPIGAIAKDPGRIYSPPSLGPRAPMTHAEAEAAAALKPPIPEPTPEEIEAQRVRDLDPRTEDEKRREDFARARDATRYASLRAPELKAAVGS